MPIIIAAGVAAAASLIGGMMNQAAQKAEARRQRLFEAQNLGYQAQAEGAKNLGQAEEQGSKSMMDLYRSVYS